MKMVKKVLMGLAIAASVLALAGCVPQADDTEKAIKKNSLTTQTVDYKNEGTDLYRAYKNAATAHAGALVKVTFEESETPNVKNKMGVIFNLKETKDKKNKVSNRDFYIIGLGTAPKTGDANFYVSKFTNVTDIKADNFGTKLTENKAVEVEIVPLAKANNIEMPAADSEGNITLWVYFKADKTSGGFDYAVIEDYDGITSVKIDKDTTIDMFKSEKILAQGNTHTVANATKKAVSEREWAADAKDSEIQNGIAFYANIQPDSTLLGTWELPVGKTILAAEDAE